MTIASETSVRKRKKRTGFLEKTIAGISHGIEMAIFSEENARRDAYLQRRDPRVKLLVFLALVIAAGLSREWYVLSAIYALALAGAVASKLEIIGFVKRTWLGVPLFSAAVVLPSILLPRGEPLVGADLGPFAISIYGSGLAAAGVFVLRVGVSVSLAALLIMTTRWADILRALHSLKVPNVFVMVLAMTYRYIFLLLNTVDDMFMARRGRVITELPGREHRWWVVAAITSLMSRSFRMSEDVYQAMSARGFDQSIRTMTDFRLRPADHVFAVAGAAAAAFAFYVSAIS